MSSSSFASLHASMLVRKGTASPSLESQPAPLRLRPVMVQPAAPAARGPLTETPEVRERGPTKPPGAPAPAPAPAPPPRKSEVAAGNPRSDLQARSALRASARLTHDQMRALKLAALLLDRPQQELLAEGLDLRLEALCCTSLAECGCLKKLVEQLNSGR